MTDRMRPDPNRTATMADLLAAIDRYAADPERFTLHHPDCPALRSGVMADCTCGPLLDDGLEDLPW